MSKAVIARKRGDEYQDDWFWLQAARLLKGPPVSKVGYEIEDITGFDDVVVYYDKSVLDEFGDPVWADYYQVKFHVDYSGGFTTSALTQPGFIHSSTSSLLQRALALQQKLAPKGQGVRLFVVSPWPIHPDDALTKLVSTENGEMRMDILFRGSSRSKMGVVRRDWVMHLGLSNENELRQVLRPLRIRPGPQQLPLREVVSHALAVAGYAPMDCRAPGNPYHAIIQNLHRQGHTTFSRADLSQACRAAGLFRGTPAQDSSATRLGIRSFLQWAEHLEDDTDHLLDLVPLFDNRMIRNQGAWESEVLPMVRQFLKDQVTPGNHYRMFLDTHSSVAFAVGHALGMKSGAHTVPMQRVAHGRVPWDSSDTSSENDRDGWAFDEELLNGGNEVAMAVSVTHDVIDDVRLFVTTDVPAVGRLVHAHIAGGPRSSAIRCGGHAFALAQQLMSKARQYRSTQSISSTLHLFFAAPNGFVFFAGQHGRALGKCILYEYDFEACRVGGYSRSFQLPTGED
jgi:hypothetical protein